MCVCARRSNPPYRNTIIFRNHFFLHCCRIETVERSIDFCWTKIIQKCDSHSDHAQQSRHPQPHTTQEKRKDFLLRSDCAQLMAAARHQFSDCIFYFHIFIIRVDVCRSAIKSNWCRMDVSVSLHFYWMQYSDVARNGKDWKVFRFVCEFTFCRSPHCVHDVIVFVLIHIKRKICREKYVPTQLNVQKNMGYVPGIQQRMYSTLFNS